MNMKRFTVSTLIIGLSVLMAGCIQYLPKKEASQETVIQDEGEYISPDGWSVRYDVPEVSANEIDEHTASFVYLGESAGTNMVTISYVAGKQPEEAMTEITEAWGDGEDIIRTEGIFPGTDDKWGYWRTLPPAEEGSGLSETLIGGEYNGGALLFEIISHNGEDEEQNMEVGDSLASIIDSIRYKDFRPQTMYEYIPGTYSRTDEDTGAVYSVILNEDHTGILSFQDDVDIYWGSYQIFTLTGDNDYEYTIEGDDLLLDQDGIWVTYSREDKTADDQAWWQKTIAYEIYVKSFKDSDGNGLGDLNGITSELDHLKDLGVGAIWLTPCYVSPQADNGYDIADYYNIDPLYGTMEDMENLIAEAGKRDIRIVMDLVFNHTSNENEWFEESRSSSDNEKSDWYIWADPKEDGSEPTNWRSIFGGSAWQFDQSRQQYYLHTFLPEQPDLNWANPEVREALIDVADFWIEKGVGGFRLDAITYIKKPEVFADGTADAGDGMADIHAMTANTEGILDYLNEFKDKALEGKELFTVGEANGVSSDELPYWVGEHGVFDMIFEFSHVLIDLPDESNWCRTRDWTLPEFKALFTASEEMTSGDDINGWYPVFLENHDQPRSINHFLPEGADRIQGAKALAALLLTLRGTPFVMQGEELGFVNVSWPDIDSYNDISTRNHYLFALEEGYSEEEAMEGVHRFARDSARTPMQWNTSENAGFTTGDPWLPVYDDYEIFNVETEAADPDSILNCYRELSDLRESHRELVNGSYEELLPDDPQIFAYIRDNGKHRATVLINLSGENASYDEALTAGCEKIFSVGEVSESGVLPPYSAVIYEEIPE
ncbi:MAG: alpha-glucosidase [Lachnospiraceae bacterium]|nr:alpha-glucosidase [Lachnospiraceae bacterium]